MILCFLLWLFFYIVEEKCHGGGGRGGVTTQMNFPRVATVTRYQIVTTIKSKLCFSNSLKTRRAMWGRT